MKLETVLYTHPAVVLSGMYCKLETTLSAHSVSNISESSHLKDSEGDGKITFKGLSISGGGRNRLGIVSAGGFT
jgi:hypothetical protein